MFEFVGDQTVSELGVVRMHVERGIGQMRVVPVPLRNPAVRPLVVALLGDLQHLARHRDRHPNTGTGRGQLLDERVDYFGRRRFAWDRYAAARRSTSFSISSSRIRFNA